MSDAPGNVVQINRVNESPSTDEVLERLARTLLERSVPRRRPLATGTVPTPAEGLALLEGYTKIGDPELRQAVLDVLSALSRRVDA